MSDGIETLTRDGAEFVARTIRLYWSKRGYPDVKVRVERAGWNSVVRADYFIVRSDMLNGWPR